MITTETIPFEGSGSGSGSGSGYGYGYGSGYGSGYGYGYGDKDPKATEAYYSALTDVVESHAARKQGAMIALWRSTSDARAANGGDCDPVKPGTIQETKGPLRCCRRGTLHATLRPDKWGGARLWVVAMYGDLAFDEHKIGALKREILAEVQGYVKSSDDK